MSILRVLFRAAACLALLPAIVFANARVLSVRPLDGGCVAAPIGRPARTWDLQPGKRYEIVLSQVSSCEHGSGDGLHGSGGHDDDDSHGGYDDWRDRGDDDDDRHRDDDEDEEEARTLNVRINSTSAGNTDLVATRIGHGQYRVVYSVPARATCTMPIFYCTSPGRPTSGRIVTAVDDSHVQAQLRAAQFSAGCTQAVPVSGSDCLSTPVLWRSWGQVKLFYR